MKKIFLDAPDVPQGVANRGVRIIEKHLRLHKAERVKELPEEAKVRLLLDLKSFFNDELGDDEKIGHGGGHDGFWRRLWTRIENILETSANEWNFDSL